MKIIFKSKTAILSLIVAAGISVGVYSCKKDSSSATGSAPSEADMVELTTDAVASSYGGLSLQLSSSVTVYKTVALSCGVEKDSTITRASVSGAVPSYSYSLKYAYVVSCTGLVPNQLTCTFSGSSAYSGLLMSSSDNSSGSFVLTGLPATNSAYTVNSTYSRSGSQTSKIGSGNTFTSALSIKSSNITVDKTSQLITGGTAAVSITGSSSSGVSYSFAGTITFLGGNKGTLVLNSGVTYNLAWQ